MLFPGGGDITPAFFGERDRGSRSIDTELDILQLQALEYCLQSRLPVLGICKGMQIINVGLGGNIIQDLPTADCHRYLGADQYHGVYNVGGQIADGQAGKGRNPVPLQKRLIIAGVFFSSYDSDLHFSIPAFRILTKHVSSLFRGLLTPYDKT